MNSVTLESLVGAHSLNGVEMDLSRGAGNGMLIQLGGLVYRIEEDEDDGYRSSLGDVTVVSQNLVNTFPTIPVIATMSSDGDHYGECDILQFRDVRNNEIILEFGTENTNDYYPSCVMSWCPEKVWRG